MGFSSGPLSHYLWLGREGKIRRGARVLELGSQNLFGDFDLSVLRRFIDFFGPGLPISDDELRDLVLAHGKVERLMRAAGFRYTAFDMYSDSHTRRFDLNTQSLPWRYRRAFDVVTNLGTSEHVANQYNVFKVAHDALKPGGVMINGVPFYGQIDHGLVNYHPKFFTTLIANNGYKTLYFGLSEVFSGGGIDYYRGLSDAVGGADWEGWKLGCAEMSVIFEKTSTRAFRPPTDFVLKGDVNVGYPTVNAILPSVEERQRFG